MIRQNVDGHGEALARTGAAYGRRAKDHPGKMLVRMPEQQRLAQSLVLVVQRQGEARVVLPDLGSVRDAINRARGGKDEPPGACFPGSDQDRLAGTEVSRRPEVGRAPCRERACPDV